MKESIQSVIRKKHMRTISVIRLFVLANMGVFAVFTVIWLYPTLSSRNNARDITAQQLHAYAAYQAQAEQYPVAMVYPAHKILPYAYLAAAMADIGLLARLHEMETRLFSASEPVSHGTVNSRSIVEIRVSASFVGLEENAVLFTYSLAESAANIRSLQMEMLGGGQVYMQVELSLFGRGE